MQSCSTFYFSFQGRTSQLLYMMYLVGILRLALLMFIIFGCFVFFLDLSTHLCQCQQEKGGGEKDPVLILECLRL